MTVQTFNLQMERFLERARIAPRRAIRKIVFDVFLEVLKASPVDTGRFRANWRVAIGGPDLTTDEGTRTDRTLGQKATVGIDGTEEIWITNNLPYAPDLEGGWSSQAPNGVLEPSVLRVVAKLRESIGTA